MTDSEAIELLKLGGVTDSELYGPLDMVKHGEYIRWERRNDLTIHGKNMIKLVNIVEERVLARKR